MARPLPGGLSRSLSWAESWRYTDILTREAELSLIMEELFSPPYNFGAIPSAGSAPETSKVFVLQAPYDSTTSFRNGSREGPHAIITASQALELYDLELGRETYEMGIHTLPELEP